MACGLLNHRSQSMAQLPQFVFSPSTLISAIGFMRGADTTPATPARDWRSVTVDVVIPARNEQDNIVRCLASVVRQTRQPRTHCRRRRREH